ncbi:MAG: EAL domain-containing protein [Coxiellaceae bacterium]|nr:EAL domain-containing protein [Coxiellaceae bacterium]
MIHDVDYNTFMVLTHRAAKHASKALSILTKQIVIVEIDAVINTRTLEEIMADNGSDKTCISLKIQGDVGGHSLLVLDKNDADRLANKLVNDIKNIEQVDRLKQSALKETGNIVVGSFLTVISNALGVNIVEDLPELLHLNNEEVLSKLHVDLIDGDSHQIWAVQATFKFIEMDIKSDVVFIFKVDGISQALNKGKTLTQRSQDDSLDVVLVEKKALSNEVVTSIMQKMSISRLSDISALKNKDNTILSNATCLIYSSATLDDNEMLWLQDCLSSEPHLAIVLVVDDVDEKLTSVLYGLGLSACIRRSALDDFNFTALIQLLFNQHQGWEILCKSEQKYKQYFNDIITGNISEVYAPSTDSGFMQISESSALKENEDLIARLKKAAHYDYLTSIPNRKYFEESLQRQINRAERVKEPFYLSIIDIDHFKTINDTHGHDVGDQLLKEVAMRMKQTLRGMDIYARLGGDEFAIILTDPKMLSNAGLLALRLLEELRRPYAFMGRSLNVTVSIGVAQYVPDEAMTFNHIMKHADLALYQSKQNGRNQYTLYALDIGALQKRQHDIEVALLNAIERDELFLMYQPIVNIETNEIAYFEALVRWDSADLDERVAPDEFIPIAENSGKILQLTEHILTLVCKDIVKLQKQMVSKLPIAINFSVLDLLSEGFVHRLHETIKGYGLNAADIQTELTETAVMENHQVIHKAIEELRELGYHISIDDFGTGYSSLARLRDMHFDSIKIDRAFIQKMLVDTSAMQIIRAVLELTKQLGIIAIAEGVEREEQVELLQQWGCKYVQGYYYSKPVCYDETQALIEKHNGDSDVHGASLPGKIYKLASYIRTIGHDVNNQLAGLLGYAEILLQKTTALSDNYTMVRCLHAGVVEAIDLVNKMSTEVQYIQNLKTVSGDHIKLLEEVSLLHAQQLFRCVIQIDYALQPMINTITDESEDIRRKIKRIAELILSLKALNEKLMHVGSHIVINGNNDDTAGVGK